MKGKYTITLKNCAFFARHGLYGEEATLGQRFFVDAVFDVVAGSALEEDVIENTVDYGVAFKVIEEIVTNTRRNLIEALANDIASAMLGRFDTMTRAHITVRKPSAPIQGVLDYVQVSVERVR